jgi:hypothetical protein
VAGDGSLSNLVGEDVDAAVAAIIGVFVGAVGTWVRSALTIREKANEEVRDRRIETYPSVYRLTAPLSLWPPARLNYQELHDINIALRGWYFSGGGLYFSKNSRDRYGELKELICRHLASVQEGGDLAEVLRLTYDDLTETARAFRGALTEDLETRRQRSLWWLTQAWILHKAQHRKWEERKARAGEGEIIAYPLSAMPLPDTGTTSQRSVVEDIEEIRAGIRATP